MARTAPVTAMSRAFVKEAEDKVGEPGSRDLRLPQFRHPKVSWRSRPPLPASRKPIGKRSRGTMRTLPPPQCGKFATGGRGARARKSAAGGSGYGVLRHNGHAPPRRRPRADLPHRGRGRGRSVARDGVVRFARRPGRHDVQARRYGRDSGRRGRDSGRAVEAALSRHRGGRGLRGRGFTRTPRARHLQDAERGNRRRPVEESFTSGCRAFGILATRKSRPLARRPAVAELISFSNRLRPKGTSG